VGAGKFDRVQKGVRQGSLIAQSVSVTLVILILILGRFLFGIFTETEALIDLAGRMMRIMAVGYIAVSITQVLGGVMRGCGNTVTPMWISIISTVVLRIPLAYAIAFYTRSAEYPHGHPYALSISLLVSWVMGMLMSAVAFRFGKTRRLIREEMARQGQL
jgi:Na+-driven multidrug efflux pump